MASRKKQEDKNLKILRELVTQYPNKKCFDCSQRGPTYVNMTIGAFVCTSCSGLLRGLNPPHRIKSISMASFNQTEIEFLQKHGNEVCRNTWLALWKSTSENESHEDIKDHLVNKYERKVWYSDQVKNVAPDPPPAKPLKSLLGNDSSQVYVSTSTPVNTTSSPLHVVAKPLTTLAKPVEAPRQQASSNMDLLGNLGADPFGSTPQNASQSSSFGTFQQPPPPQSQQPLFNAFSSSDVDKSQDSFDLFVSSRPNNQIADANFSAKAPTAQPQPQPSAADKYAALAELDMNKATITQSVFSAFAAPSYQTSGGGTAQPNPFMSTNTSSSGVAVFQQQQQKPANPFQSSSLPATNTNPMQNVDIFQQMPPQNSTDVKKQNQYAWGNMNGNNVAPNLGHNPGMASNQPNFNYSFGPTSQPKAPNSIQPNANSVPNQQQALFGNAQPFGNNQLLFRTQQQPAFHNSQQPQQPQAVSQEPFGFPTHQFNSNFGNQNNEQMTYGQTQQSFASSFTQQPAAFGASKSSGAMPDFNQTPQNQAAFAFSSQMPYKPPPTKSTNPFM